MNETKAHKSATASDHLEALTRRANWLTQRIQQDGGRSFDLAERAAIRWAIQKVERKGWTMKPLVSITKKEEPK